MAVISPAMFCGTRKLYCAALPSSKPFCPNWPGGGATKPGPDGNAPVLSLGRRYPVPPSKMFCQFCARVAKVRAVS